MKIIFSIIAGIVLLPLLGFGIFLLYINTTDYQPEPVEELRTQYATGSLAPNTEHISLITWNIGYAGLDKSMDFFYDGGRKVRTSYEATRENLNQIITFMLANPADVWLLQEVDFDARRTYGIDQAAAIGQALSDYHLTRAVNYDVPFVPVPLREPMGRVLAGQLTLSRPLPRLARRYSYPLIAGWPDRLFLLDRCFIETRYNLDNGAELVVLNTHNSAFVDNQLLMDKELEVIRNKMQREFELGNYVIAGGDWNMNPPAFRPADGYGGHRFEPVAVSIPAELLPKGWQLAYDSSTPSNRFLDEAFEKGSTRATTIDFFIVSPNISIKTIKAIDLGFGHSDHNPVKLEVTLR
ncbi:MAG: endonuclease/exonuclease/phosphatase family protein [Bacteroidetes bacterium]|nr:endonuclease/exonuclease/phosphatase family protein [Bacteroidota bacterium]